jgi:uncharacterized protein
MGIKGIFRNVHPFQQLVYALFIALASLLAVMIVGMLMALPFLAGHDWSLLMNGNLYSDPDAVPLLKYLQLLQSFGLFIIPPFVFAYLFSDHVARALRINKKPGSKGILLSIAMVWFASPLINELGMWNASIELPPFLSGLEEWMKEKEAAAEELTNLFIETKTIGGLLFNIVLIGIIPGVGEELLFRGVIQKIFAKWTRSSHWAIWLTAALFSALHLQFYGFFPRMLLGAMFGYMLVWSGNLWLPILAHFINNATAVVAYYLYERQLIPVDPDELGTGSEYGFAIIISMAAIVGAGYLLWRTGKGTESEREHRLQE